jgi:hypothetical protein
VQAAQTLMPPRVTGAAESSQQVCPQTRLPSFSPLMASPRRSQGQDRVSTSALQMRCPHPRRLAMIVLDVLLTMQACVHLETVVRPALSVAPVLPLLLERRMLLLHACPAHEAVRWQGLLQGAMLSSL